MTRIYRYATMTTILLLVPSGALALPGSPTAFPWVASADYVQNGQTLPGGIVVTESSHAACASRFADAMASATMKHGYTFTNIEKCHFLPTSFGGGLIELAEAAEELSLAIQQLEEEYNFAEFDRLRARLVRQFHRRAKEEGESPPEVRPVEQRREP